MITTRQLRIHDPRDGFEGTTWAWWCHTCHHRSGATFPTNEDAFHYGAIHAHICTQSLAGLPNRPPAVRSSPAIHRTRIRHAVGPGSHPGHDS